MRRRDGAIVVGQITNRNRDANASLIGGSQGDTVNLHGYAERSTCRGLGVIS